MRSTRKPENFREYNNFMVTAEITISKEDLLGLRNPMTLIGVDWEIYEEVSEELGETTSLHLTFNKGSLTFMPVTELHEFLTSLLHNFITFAGIALRKNVVPTGKATMRSKTKQYGVEPDLSFFISKADVHIIKSFVPNELQTAPDIVCEIDVHHPSDDKFEIYAQFGVAEFWQYDGIKLSIYKLQPSGEYKEIERSEELPVLTSEILSVFLKRGQDEAQFTNVLSDFQDWLQNNK
jgi:Uma2 family endonuclease